MSYLFKGSLHGQICEDCIETLSGIEVRLYLPWRRNNETHETNGKDNFRIVSAAEAKQREELLIAKTTTDANGNFSFKIEEEYQQAAFDIDIICHTVPFAVRSRSSGTVTPYNDYSHPN